MRIKIPRWIISFILFTAWVCLVSTFKRTSLLYPLLFAPVIEELVFRYSVLEIVMRNKKLRKVKWQIIFLTSFIFGYIHGHQNMFIIQGVMGVILSFTYLKVRKANNPEIAYIAVVIFHALWNTLCVFGLKYLI